MDKFANLPGPLKWILGLGGVGALVGVGGAAGSGHWKVLLIFALVLIGLLVLLVGGWMLWNAWQRKKQNARLGGELQQSTTASPRGMTATDLARLDSLRKKFQEGVEAFRSRGKDLYTLPWYVIIGEPGSGKTEAVRHCNVGFPPGMHEGENDTGYMGAGGTINMNWWFTNYAVLLDTAGRLVFEDIKPGETSEWKEFLKLLKKNRPYCPINGLLLVIPSDSLIKDSADQIAAKAGKIAQQLDVIQRVLDFRFPVYVVITKSDKINGFREFFEGLTDPQLQHQMLGWANADPLDSPFRPDVVDKHLTEVADRLRRRRMGLMRDPVPETATRRTDEVDSLYALPNSLVLLAPRLRSYLEKIFMPGEWSSKPLFLRGIYFTSSMREGAALDQELAEAIGVPADELPEGKVWERDRAYFLKDLFVDKVFKEKGLVTRATNTGAMLRRRQMILYGTCFSLLALFVIIAWMGMRTVRSEVGNRAELWAAANDVGWEGKTWKRSLLEPQDNGTYRLVSNVRFPKDNKISVGELHQKFVQLATNQLKERWTSRGLAGSYNRNSRRAQRVIFEDSVLQPVLSAVNERMASISPEKPEPYQADTLATLIRLESDVLKREKGGDVPLDTRGANNVLGSLLRFATGTNVDWTQTELDPKLVSAMVWTYSENPAGANAWPPRWLSSTTTTKAGALTNVVLMSGLDYFISRATNTVQVMAGNWSSVADLIKALEGYEAAERAVLGAPAGSALDAPLQSALAARDKLDLLVQRCGKSNIFAGGLLLTNAYFNFTNEVTRYAGDAFNKVNSENEAGLKANSRYKVFEDIRARLRSEQSRIEGSLTSIVPAGIWPRMIHFDECFLGAGGGSPLYARRAAVYQQAANLSDPAWFASASRAELVSKLDAWDKAQGSVLQAANDCKGCLQEELKKLATAMRDRAVASQPKVFLAKYQQVAQSDLAQNLGFPVFRGATTKVRATDELDKAQHLLDQIRDEVAAIDAKKFEDSKEWRNFATRIASISTVARVIKGSKDKVNYCTISLLPYDGGNSADAWRSSYRKVRVKDTPKILDASSEEGELGKVDLRGPCNFQFYKIDPDKETALDLGESRNWGPLWLITQYSGKPAPDGSWTVAFPVDRLAAGGKLRLKLRFDEPLPDLDHWPEN